MKKKIILSAMLLGLLVSGCGDNQLYTSSDGTKHLTKQDRDKYEAERFPALVIDGKWTYEIDGNYSYIRGSVKNMGNVPIRYFEVHACYHNKSGAVVDTDYTNSGEILQPGWSKRFEIMHRERPEFKSASIRIENIRLAK